MKKTENKKGRLPKILRINEINGLKISVLFSMGQDRVLDFEKIFNKLKVTPKSPEYKLYDPKEFKKVRLNNYTLCWDNVLTKVKLSGGRKFEFAYEIGADVLFKLSEPDVKRENLKVGETLRKLRIKSGMTQDELASLSGTSRTYISRIENNKSDIELYTLEKIIKAGFNKRIKISFI